MTRDHTVAPFCSSSAISILIFISMAFFSIVEVLLVPVLGGRAQNITKIVLTSTWALCLLVFTLVNILDGSKDVVVIAIYLASICFTVGIGYWVFLLCDIEKFLTHLPVLVNFGIFLATVGCDIAQRTPEEREGLVNNFRMAKGMIAGSLGWMASMFAGQPWVAPYASGHLEDVELAARRPTAGAVSPGQ